MPIIQNKINKILKDKNLSLYELGKRMSFSDGALCNMIKAKSPFSEKAIEKLLPILEVSREEFESWILADKYTKEVLKLAIQVKKAFPYKKKRILTTKIDAILQEKGISRTTLSKEIKYSQSGLNSIITEKRPMSKSVMERLSMTLNVSMDEISSWIVADNYDLNILELAYNL